MARNRIDDRRTFRPTLESLENREVMNAGLAGAAMYPMLLAASLRVLPRQHRAGPSPRQVGLVQSARHRLAADGQVSAVNAYGHVDPTFADNVAIALQNNPGSATLGGILTATAINGAAAFSNLTIAPQYTYSNYTKATAASLTAVTTGSFTAGVETLFVGETLPPSTVSGNQPFTPSVAAAGGAGTVDPAFNGTVTVALVNYPADATLGGTLTVNTVNGVATFSGLTLNKPGVGYSLHMSRSDRTGTPAATVTVVVPLPSPLPDPSSLPPAPPSLNVPPLLAYLNRLLGVVETVNANSTETITGRLSSIPILVSTFDPFGNLMSVTMFGANVTFSFGVRNRSRVTSARAVGVGIGSN
ncbi:MAG TPA: hypothetical protein VH592_18260 [Gemmataceae bacterium]|jgi:hypothetical protein